MLSHIVKRLAFFVILLITLMVLTGCPTPETATPVKTTEPPPSEAAIIDSSASGYTVEREATTVWATINNATPQTLVTVGSGGPFNIIGEKMVTTDDDGIALIEGPDCASLYIFQSSGLTWAPCMPGSSGGQCVTGAIASADCEFTIDTMPATVSVQGTWFTVIYSDEYQVTLVIVADGVVNITSYADLEYRLVDKDTLEFEVTTRDPETVVETEIVAEGEPLYLYTASDANIAKYREAYDLPPAREPLPLAELSPVRDMLREQDPYIDRWISDVWEQGSEDGYEFPVLSEELATLVTWEDGNIVPNLAESWMNDPERTWIFYLDQERVHAYPEPITAEVIIERIIPYFESCDTVEGYGFCAEALDDYTVQFYYLEGSEPDPNFLETLSQIELDK